MKYCKIILFVLISIFLASCDFISSGLKSKENTESFINNLIKEDYNTSCDYIAMDVFMKEYGNADSIKHVLSNYRSQLVRSFGTELKYTFLKAEKRKSTIASQNTPEGTMVAFIQFNNKEYFGVFEVLIDDISGKILKIITRDIKEPIPSMVSFYFIGLIAILVPIFNIYMIYRIKKSSLSKKWVKYLAILFFNIPTVTYSAVNGFSISLLNFQILFGLSFCCMGYMYSYWAIGIPFGGLYWFWRLNKKEESKKSF